jgi:hypothetical protein
MWKCTRMFVSKTTWIISWPLHMFLFIYASLFCERELHQTSCFHIISTQKSYVVTLNQCGKLIGSAKSHRLLTFNLNRLTWRHLFLISLWIHVSLMSVPRGEAPKGS